MGWSHPRGEYSSPNAGHPHPTKSSGRGRPTPSLSLSVYLCAAATSHNKDGATLVQETTSEYKHNGDEDDVEEAGGVEAGVEEPELGSSRASWRLSRELFLWADAAREPHGRPCQIAPCGWLHSTSPPWAALRAPPAAGHGREVGEERGGGRQCQGRLGGV